MSTPSIRDPKVLHRYLVRLAMEAYDGGPRHGSPIEVDNDRDAFEDRARERMAQAATAIVCELDVASRGVE